MLQGPELVTEELLQAVPRQVPSADQIPTAMPWQALLLLETSITPTSLILRTDTPTGTEAAQTQFIGAEQMPGHEPEFNLPDIPIFIGPATLGRLLDVPEVVARIMLETSVIKSFDVGPAGATFKRTTLKEIVDYFNHIT